MSISDCRLIPSSDIVLFVAPFSYNPLSTWYSPGRFQKISQVENLLTSLRFSIFRINTAPDPISDKQFGHLQLSPSNVPILRIFQSLASTFTFLLSQPFRFKAPILWIYNTRLSEGLIALLILLFLPSIPLYLQIEDLPFARKQNAGLRGFLDLLTLHILVTRSDHIFVVSHHVGQTLQKLSRRSLPSLSVLPPHLSTRFLRIVKQRSRPFIKPTTTILYAGAYGEEKGVNDLIQAFLSIRTPGFILQLAGSVPDTLAKSITANPNIHIIGYVSNSHLFHLYSGADVVVCPHHVSQLSSYIFPFKLVEYAASGALPLFTRMPGTESLGLPSDCYFDSLDELASKLRDARSIWTRNHDTLVVCEEQLRDRYSFASIQSLVASSMARITHHVNL